MVGDNFETYVQIMENLFASKKTEWLQWDSNAQPLSP